MTKMGIWQQIRKFISKALVSLSQLRNGEMLSFLFFLFIATMIWFLHTTQSEMQSTITYPIHYKDLPGHITVSNELPNSIQVSIKDKGARLYAYYFKRKKNALDIDLMALRSNDGICSVPTKTFEAKIHSHLNPNAQIMRISPDSLKVYFVENEKKTIPVELISDISLATQHMLTGKIEISPASIQVSAPSVVLDSISMIETEKLTINDINDTTYCRIKLKTQDGLRYEQNEVEVMIPVEAFTEASFDIELQALDFPEGYILRSFPQKVNVKFLVRESIYPQIKAEDFIIGISYKDLIHSPTALMQPTIIRQPSDIRRLIIKPGQVECLIEKL